MFTPLAFLGIFLVTQVAKKYVSPKFGDTGVHVFVFVLALIVISVKGFMTTYPPFGDMVIMAGQYLLASLGLYKIIIKPLLENTNLFGSQNVL